MKSALKIFRMVALLEGISFILLVGIAMPLKYLYDMPTANKVIGMLHGMLFVAYVFYLYQVQLERKWDLKKITYAFIASLLPFGTFVLDAKILKHEKE
ncbi:MAG: DUF3817 domain-containing protein [Bacteroidia bacterium]|nr:DUF3817 domain-containing protein [Bacteroidia bacterium]